MVNKWFVTFLFIASLWSTVSGDCQVIPASGGEGGHSGSCDSSSSVSKLLHNYDRAIKPNASTPVKVGVTLIFEFVKWRHNVLHISAYLRQKWNDPRFVRKEGITRFNSDHIIHRMWKPDTYFMNAWNPTSVVQTGFVDIQHNGNVTYSKQVQFQVYCPMSVNYAINNNGNVNCDIQITSYSYDQTEVTFFWHEDPTFSDQYQRVPSFDATTSKSSYSTGSWSVAELKLQVQTLVNKAAVDLIEEQTFDKGNDH